MMEETTPNPFEFARRRMIDYQIRARNISDPRVLEAMTQIPREVFVPNELQELAYEDRALPIGNRQTISQPYMVALMTEKLSLDPSYRVLEVGTGSGYQTAILAKLAKEVYTVERIEELSTRARSILERLGLTNVHYKIDDGTMGWSEFAPFDRIVVTAGAPTVPHALIDQLGPGGVMIIPVGADAYQTLMRIERTEKGIREKSIIACQFVKLIGRHGWRDKNDRE